jgi:hypothetical protein
MTSASASRVTRSSRSLRRAALLCAGVLAGISVLRAQEPPAASPPEAVPAAAEPAPTGPAAPAPAAGPKAADPKAAGKPGQPANSTSTPSRFEPTEKVRADFDVSFPIDI